MRLDREPNLIDKVDCYQILLRPAIVTHEIVRNIAPSRLDEPVEHAEKNRHHIAAAGALGLT